MIASGAVGLELDESVAAPSMRCARTCDPGQPPLRGGYEHAAVRRARAYLGERWDHAVPLAELSAVAGLTRFELVRRFRAQTGLTPHAFQTNLRVEHARTAAERRAPDRRGRADCGFADQPHLTRTFKRAVGVTPGRFAAAA